MVEVDENYVRMAKCPHCGKENGEILLNTRLQEIPEDQVFSSACESCKKLFKTHKFFLGSCGHNGFIKLELLKKMLKKNAFKELTNHNIFGMEKCPSCMGFVDIKDCNKL